MKVILVGIWVTLVALGSSWLFATRLKPADAATGAAKEAKDGPPGPPPTQFLKTRAVSVPVIAEGIVQGYAVVQCGITIDTAAAKRANVPPEVFVIDEIFRYFYADERLDFRHLGNLDIPTFVHTIQDRANKRLGEPVLKSVLLQEMTYVPKQSEKL